MPKTFRELADCVVADQRWAILAIAAVSFVPLISWIADVIMLLVTLRKGWREGGVLLLCAALPSLIFAVQGNHSLLYDVVGASLVSYVLALLLRMYNWVVVLQALIIFGMVGVVIMHLLIPDIIPVRTEQLTGYFFWVKKQSGWAVSAEQVRDTASFLAKLSTGAQVSVFLFAGLPSLFIARWLQAFLYNPGKFRVELYNLRLNWLAAGVLLVTVLLATAFGNALAVGCLPVVFLPFVLSGLSLLHSVRALTKVTKVWLFLFYSLLFLFFPYAALLLVLFALADVRYDFRRLLQNKA